VLAAFLQDFRKDIDLDGAMLCSATQNIGTVVNMPSPK
jgi:hypothetical protein